MTWHVLEPILVQGGFAHDAPHLVAQVRLVAEAADPLTRDRALMACVATLDGNGHAVRLLRLLATTDEPLARQLALELFARLSPPTDASGVNELRPLLRDRRLPAVARLAAAVTLVRSTDGNGKSARQVLRDFAAGYGRVRFLDELPALRQHFAKLPALDHYAERLCQRLPMRCPRCGVKRRHQAMAGHLWRQHRLLLDEGRAHTPWRMLGQWLNDSAAGPFLAYRQLLRHGLRDPNIVDRLQSEAGRSVHCLCPQCYAAVPLDPGRFPTAERNSLVHSAGGRLSGHGFVVAVSERGWTPRLRVETPQGIVFEGPTPRGRLTVQGRRWLGVGGLVVLAFAIAALLPPPLVFVATLIALLVALEIGLLLWTQRPPDLAKQAVDHAWRLLAPHAHSGGFRADDAAFCAGLARASIDRGDARAREQALGRLVKLTTAAVQMRKTSLALLAPLLRVQAADAAVTGGDPVRLLAEAVGPCFGGERPPSWADLVLSEDALAGWTRGQRARLRVLLAGRAFAAGLGVWELHELGRAVPGLGRVLDPDDTDGLARLRLLWDLRASRPWQRCGPAATVFELANYPMLGGQYLESAPDLLLFQPLPAGGGGTPDHLLVCGRGLILRDALIHERPKALDVRPLPNSKGGGYALQVGPYLFQFSEPPEAIARRLEAWFGFFFEELLPKTADVLARPNAAGVKRLLRRLVVRCPECGIRFRALQGHNG